MQLIFNVRIYAQYLSKSVKLFKLLNNYLYCVCYLHHLKIGKNKCFCSDVVFKVVSVLFYLKFGFKMRFFINYRFLPLDWKFWLMLFCTFLLFCFMFSYCISNLNITTYIWIYRFNDVKFIRFRILLLRVSKLYRLKYHQY